MPDDKEITNGDISSGGDSSSLILYLDPVSNSLKAASSGT